MLVDAALDNGDSYRCVETLRKTAPEAKVIVMDLLPAPEEVIEFVKAGANGFIMKDATVEDLVSTIRSVALGADVVPPALTGTLLSHIAQQAVVRRLPGVAEAVRMTKREREIMNLIAEGMSNKEIAQRLSIATYTVKSHVHNILEKLALHSRLQIAAYTHKAGLAPRRGSPLRLTDSLRAAVQARAGLRRLRERRLRQRALPAFAPRHRKPRRPREGEVHVEVLQLGLDRPIDVVHLAGVVGHHQDVGDVGLHARSDPSTGVPRAAPPAARGGAAPGSS